MGAAPVGLRKGRLPPPRVHVDPARRALPRICSRVRERARFIAGVVPAAKEKDFGSDDLDGNSFNVLLVCRTSGFAGALPT